MTFTEVEIKPFTKKQKNTNTQKEISYDLKQFNDCLLQSSLKDRCLGNSSRRAGAVVYIC